MTSNNTEDTVPLYPLITIVVDLKEIFINREKKKKKKQQKKIVNCLKDLQLASYKVKEVDRLIAEQKWKLRDKI
jgi:hypothetical protein